MARAFLIAAGALWLGAGLAGVALSVAGIDVIEALLPPLAIARDALARTVAALGVGAMLVGIAHAVVARGLGRSRSWAPSAGILLAGVWVAGSIGMVAAALTAGAAGSLAGEIAILAAIAGVVIGVAYAATGVTLARRLRSKPSI